MVAMPQVAQLVNHRVFQHGPGGEDQLPIQIDDPVDPAASPQVPLFLDPDVAGSQPVRLPVFLDEVGGVLPKPLFQP